VGVRACGSVGVGEFIVSGSGFRVSSWEWGEIRIMIKSMIKIWDRVS
jgi:hypothetical protein